MQDMWPVRLIHVEPGRQRREKNFDSLLESIRARGIITPLIVEPIPDTDQVNLRAGERRLMCAIEIGLEEVPVRLLTDLSPIEREIIELEENLHRKSLTWQELCTSVKRIHKMYCRINPQWLQEKTAEAICLSTGSIAAMLAVASELELENPNPRILAATHWRAAYNIIVRSHNRKADDAFSELMEEPDAKKSEYVLERDRIGTTGPIEVSADSQFRTEEPSQTVSEPLLPICQADFREWAPNYRGSLFQFVHCDFPYGIRLDTSAQGYSGTWGSYKDSEETYWELIKCLCDNLERIMAPSSHLMFWLSAKSSTVWETISYFQSNSDLDFNITPLIWHKSDNRGILADPKRGPRHVYETAIFATRGQRFIAQAVSDAYSSPAGDKSHQSEKSEAMLRHFFRMFIDEGTRMLDPTCGAGSSLRAGNSLGADVLGFDISEEHVDTAKSLYRKFLNLKKLGGKNV